MIQARAAGHITEKLWGSFDMKARFVSCCSFCGKPVNKVKKLIGTPKGRPPAYICDECVATCNSILEKHSGPAGKQETNSPGMGHGLHRVSAEPSKKENWLDRVKSWWKYGMIGKATLPDNL